MTTKIFAVAVLFVLLGSFLAVAPVPVVEATPDGIFKITMVAPGSANLLRRQWALIIANSFKSVGIDARVVFMTWGSVYDRILTPQQSLIGKTYDEGGFDALFIGWTPGNPSAPYSGSFQIYYSENLPPDSNYFLWNNSESDALIEKFMTEGYTTEGIKAFKDWQYVQYIDVPASQIIFTSAIFTASKDLNFNGYEWIFDNIGPTPQYLTGMSEVVLATTGELLDLNPPLSNSWYDTLAFNSIFDSMFILNNDYEYVPGICTSFDKSADGYTFTYHLRNDVYFHDGVRMTADDVVFSFLAYLNPQTGSQQSGYESGYIGNDITFKWEDGTETRLVIDMTDPENPVVYYPAPSNVTGTRPARIEAVDQFTVRITIADFGALGKPVATFHPEGDGVAILPKHVLGNVPFSEWKNHPFNKGTEAYTSNGKTFYGPIGTGPYVFKSYDPVNQLVTLEKYNDYWDKASLESQGFFTVQKFYIKYIIEKDSAIAALKNGVVHILDQNYQLGNDYAAGNLDFAKSYELRGSGIQQLGYNMRHPIFGTGVDTPLGRSNPARAAEAARYVRQALDYLIPRQLIIDNLLGGFGEPAAVHVNPVSPYYNSSIVAREYNPTKAKELLAMAGYATGVTPTTPTVLTNYILGNPITFEGTFDIDPVVALQQEGIVALLLMSTDNSTFTPVAQTIVNTGGYYK
ncbi:MAG: ABC transporter substrate-binding protein, partial [Candidatus Verstraetearchaeota archaeon]|nr:ABC transporter substrate-binding protein [Candidatus Verstraetearchaeota archaeon]